MTDQEQIAGAAVADDQRDVVAPAAEPEIDIQEIKAGIQRAVARRQAAGQTSFINASVRLLELLSREPLPLPGQVSVGVARVNPFRSQPEFIPSSNDHYHVTDLLKYHDIEFVWNAYRALLKRGPDTEGFNAFLGKLRSGRFNKIDVLAGLRHSPEGKRNRVTIDGLLLPATIRRLYRVPVIGYVIELVAGVARLPSLIHNQRQIESYVIAQQKLLADHFDRATAELSTSLELSRSRLTELRESFALSLSRLEQQQKAIARAQHQQVAALFREQQRNGSLPASKSDGRDRRLVLDELYASFENQFRGTPEHIKEGFKVYLPLLKDAGITSDILDLGCGRGEWLELLREEGWPARGVESNRAMIDNQRGQNLEIVQADALAYLRGLPDNSLRAVTAFHFVEHIGLAELIDLLDEIKRVLKPGGLLIVETPNPKNLVVGACNFYSDPTHHKPLFPETLDFIVNHRGFVRTQLQYLHPVEGSPFQESSEASQALNSWLFSARDFAIVAWKPAAETS
jgi:SAM-dependent methyltransferase